MRKLLSIIGLALATSMLIACAGTGSVNAKQASPEVPAPRGDAHMIATVREFGVLDPLSDADMVEYGHLICDVIDAGGDFHDIERTVFQGITDPDAAAALFISAGAAVRSYCPEHTGVLQTWADEVGQRPRP